MTATPSTYSEPSQASTALVLGVLGLLPCCGGILAVAAWIIGNTELKGINENRRDPSNATLARAGRNLGMIITIFWGIVIIGYIALFMLGIAANLGDLGTGGF